MNVELGAGARAREGFYAVDLDSTHADIVADALHLPFEDGTVDQIRAVDVLEHISYRNTHLALAEWARVLRPNGALYVQVPDAEIIMRWYTNSDDRLRKMEGRRCTLLEGAQWRLLGGHGDGKYASDENWKFNAHYAMFSRSSLRMALHDAGFEVVQMVSNGHPNLLCDAVKP